MVIFNGYVSHNQRVTHILAPLKRPHRGYSMPSKPTTPKAQQPSAWNRSSVGVDLRFFAPRHGETWHVSTVMARNTSYN